MAKERELVIKGTLDTEEIVEGAEKAKEAIEEVNEAANGRSKRGRRGGGVKEAKKDWVGFAELFSGALPRDLGRTYTQFRRTQRGVSRATQGFKLLKGAIASLGITALIIAIEALIENWDKVSDFLGIVSKEQRALNDAQEAGTEAMKEYVGANQAYLDVLLDTEQPLARRLAAQEKLARSTEGIKDIDLEAADAHEQLMAAFAKQGELESAKEELDSLGEAYQEFLEEQEEREAKVRRFDRFAVETQGRHREQWLRRAESAQEDLDEFREDAKELTDRYEELTQKILDEEARQRKAREDAAAAEAQARLVQTKTDRAAALARENRLNDITNKAQRELAILKEKQDAEEAQFLEAGATEEEFAALREYYAEKRADIREKEAERIEKENERIIKAEQDLLTRIDDLLADDETSALAAVERKYMDTITAIEAAGGDATALYEAMNEEMLAVSERFTKQETDEAERAARDAEAKRRETMMEQREITYSQIEDEEELRKQKELDRLEDEYNEMLELYEKYQLDTTALTEKYAKDREKIESDVDEQVVISREAGAKQLEDGLMDVFDGLQSLAERGSKNAKRLAVIEVLLNQAKAISSAIAGATEAAAATGAGAPFALAGYIASMVGAVLTGFAQVKSILDEAGAQGGSAGSMRGTQATQALVPTIGGGLAEPRNMNVNAYVVQSDLQGQNQLAANMGARTSL